MPSNADPRNCAQCGNPYRHGNPKYKTCGAPRCVKQQRQDGYRKANSDASVRRRSTQAIKKERDTNRRRNRMSRDGVIISDEPGRRKIISAVESEMEKGFFESAALITVSERLGETPAAVMAVWRSRKQ